jgi:sugar/nucleoside kinase (ribokinase family)
LEITATFFSWGLNDTSSTIITGIIQRTGITIITILVDGGTLTSVCVTSVDGTGVAIIAVNDGGVEFARSSGFVAAVDAIAFVSILT